MTTIPTPRSPAQHRGAVPSTGDRERSPLASEANAALALLACLLGVVLGTELLVAVLGAIS